MAKFIIKDGKFVNQENGEAVSSLSGKLNKLEAFNAGPGDTPRLRYCFAPTAEGAEGDSFSVRRYGDTSLKILRLLHGITDIIADKTITVSFEEREGQKSLLSITADGEVLVLRGSVGPFASEKNHITDRIVTDLSRALNFSFPVSLVILPDGIHPDGFDDYLEVIRRLRRSGDTDGLVVKKTVFTNEHAFNAYRLAWNDIGRGALFTGAGLVAAIEEAYTTPREEPVSEGSDDPDEEV